MSQAGRGFSAPDLLVLIGSGLFIFILWLSAYFERDIRWLHFFQAWMYLATIWFVMRGSRWGYLIGLSAAGLWDYTNLFVTTFFRSGLQWLIAYINTGELKHVDQIIAVPAWVGNFFVVLGSVWAYARLTEKPRADLLRLGVAFTLTTGFFAAAISICQPRYLSLFRGILHPHAPW